MDFLSFFLFPISSLLLDFREVQESKYFFSSSVCPFDGDTKGRASKSINGKIGQKAKRNRPPRGWKEKEGGGQCAQLKYVALNRGRPIEKDFFGEAESPSLRLIAFLATGRMGRREEEGSCLTLHICDLTVRHTHKYTGLQKTTLGPVHVFLHDGDGRGMEVEIMHGKKIREEMKN